MSEWKPNSGRYDEKSLMERWFEDEDPFGLADGSPIPDDDPEDGQEEPSEEAKEKE